MTQNLTVVVSYDIKRKLWLAAVMEGNTVLTIGYEATEVEAQAWGEKAKECQAWEAGNDDPPDIYDRMKLAQRHGPN
jgi:hypothetical protein